MHDRDAHEVLIPQNAARRIEIDPAGAGNVGLHPGMCIAADKATVIGIR